MDKPEPSLAIEVGRWDVFAPDLDKLNAIDRTHIAWTLHDWAKEQMKRLLPLISDEDRAQS